MYCFRHKEMLADARMTITQIQKKGFTLIELLVVIAIIGILSSVVLSSLNSARAKARDAQRISTVRQIKTALELYYDTNSTYPQAGGQDAGTAFTSLAPYLTPTYISAITPDPQGAYVGYVWGSSGKSYGLWVYTEKKGSNCLTGVNVDTGWWGAGASNLCNF